MCLRRFREGKDALRLHANTIVFNIRKQFTQTFLAHISRIKGRKGIADKMKSVRLA